MADLSFKNVGITGLAAAVPKNTIDNYNYTQFFNKEDVKDLESVLNSDSALEKTKPRSGD
mgnify:CR=1 FL=1